MINMILDGVDQQLVLLWALLKPMQKNMTKPLSILKKLKNNASKLNNPYEWGLVHRVKAEMCCSLKDMEKHVELYTYIKKDIEHVCRGEIYKDHTIDRCYEIDVVRKIEDICKLCRSY